MANTGRKSKYYTNVLPKLDLVRGWARDGATDVEIADNLGINIATLYRYKGKFCEFCDALKEGREITDYKVENALLKKAIGFTYEETTTEVSDDGTTKVKTVTKQALPDSTSAIFWLKNRKPDVWRDKTHVETEAKIDAKINPYTELKTEDLKALAEKYLNKKDNE